MTFTKYPLSILCYEGDGDGDDAAAAAASAAAAAAAAADGDAGDEGDEKKFSQEDLNKILAEDKRKGQEKLRKLETTMQTLSEDRSLSEQNRKNLSSELENLRKSLRTAEQQTEYDRKQAAEQHHSDLANAQERGDHWETLYKAAEVDRSLQDAAGDPEIGAYNPRQIVNLLKPHTELKEIEGALQPMVDFPDIDEKTGSEITTLRTPVDAVKRMLEMTKVHGNLFKSTIVGGVGSASGAETPEGKVDVASLTAEQYRRIRADDPERLGLPPNRKVRK